MVTEKPKIIETSEDKWHSEAETMIEQGYFLAERNKKLYWVYNDLIDESGEIQWSS